jgi:hypothetical protein
MKLNHYLKAIRFPLITFTKLLCPELLLGSKVQDRTPKLAKSIVSVPNEVNNKRLVSKKKKDGACLDGSALLNDCAQKKGRYVGTQATAQSTQVVTQSIKQITIAQGQCM